ncbi:hypothetical protein HK102_003181, partial [Quaeritorhiza haematococci]
ILPAKTYDGYVTDFEGKVLKYRINGIPTGVATVGFYGILSYLGIRDPTFLATHFTSSLIASCLIGFTISLLLYIKGLIHRPPEYKYRRTLTIDMLPSHLRQLSSTSSSSQSAETKSEKAVQDLSKTAERLIDEVADAYSPLFRWYSGWEFNPRISIHLPLQDTPLEIDIKMLFYSWGGLLLVLTAWSMLIRHVKFVQTYQTSMSAWPVSNAALVWTWMWTWFKFEYLFHEHIHLYTYDIFGEKMGAKLVWGCMSFYAFVYVVAGTIVSSFIPTPSTPDISPLTALGILTLFYTGWTFTRGANNQKYYFKVGRIEKKLREEVKEEKEKKEKKDEVKEGEGEDEDHGAFLFGLIRQKTIRGTPLLVSGFWGLSRHINYVGEIIQGIAFSLPPHLILSRLHSTLPSTYSPYLLPLLYAFAWLFPLYFLALAISRERNDEFMCSKKYGKAWGVYVRRVRWRLAPGIY